MTPTMWILLADDHVQTVQICRRALAAHGFDVRSAATLEEASRALAESSPACLVIDAALTGGDVTDFCARARRSLEPGRALPILLLVPPRFSVERLDALAPLCDERLSKPFNVGELVSRVKALVAAAHGRASTYATEPETGQGLRIGERVGPVRDLGGNVLGGCRLERVLGQGAMGVVYLGRHLALDVPVTVKIVTATGARWSPDELQRFERGVRAAAKVQHPSVVQVLHAGKEGAFHYAVQRYVEGESLKDRMASQGRLSQRLLIRVLREIADGLAAVHRLQLVHRDVKPANIILTPAGAPVLTDFGLARPVGQGDISSQSAMVGTPYYMSPEQCDGLGLDGRSDLYSLGATAYHALAGRPPIFGDTPVAVLRGHIEQMPRPLNEVVADVSVTLAAAVMKLLAKRPEDRYQSAEELSTAFHKSV